MHHRTFKKCAGFTLLEMIVSLSVILMTCLVISANLRVSEKMMVKLTAEQAATTQLSFIQFEDYCLDKKVVFADEFKVILIGPDNVKHMMSYNTRDLRIIITNVAGEGFMPLWYHVYHAKFDYRAPLLRITFYLPDLTTYDRCFLISPTSSYEEEHHAEKNR